MASQLPSQDAWTRAKDRYIEDLTHEEKRIFLQASPEMILYDASAAEKKHGASSTSRRLIAKLQPFIAVIEQYGKALDVYSNASALVLSPLWGSIRVLLLIAREFGKYFEKLVDMLARIGDVLPRFHVYEKLFPSHERLTHALSVTYVNIIVFCSDTKAVFRRGQRASLTRLSVGFRPIWKPLESQFGQKLADFRIHLNNVEKEANLSHMVEAADARALALANRLQLDQKKNEKERRRLMALVTSIDVEAKHRRLQNLRFTGTGEWVLQNDMYLEWKQASSPSSLCCYGISGCGKSVLVSRIVDDLLANAIAHQVAIVYYYCDYADHRSLQTHRILGTVLKQLIPENEIPSEMEAKILRAYKDGTWIPEISELVDLVCSLMQMWPVVYIVLDGLDECEKSPRQDILSFLERLGTLANAIVHVFVSCRDEDQLLRSLKAYSRIQLTSAALETDIKSFVEGSVRARIASRQLTIRNPELEDQVVWELVQKSHGMFLWIYFQLDDLCEALSDAMIRKILHDLPDGLVQTYERILLKISRNSLAKQELALRVFKWTICARRPMQTEELQEAVAFEFSDSCWDKEKIPDGNLMIETCRGLLVRDKEDGTVRFAHHTVQQYLLTAPSIKSRQHFHVPPFRVLPPSEAEAFVGQICITYLCFSDFETQIIRRAPTVKHGPLDIDRVGGPIRIPNALGIGKAVTEFPYRFSGGKPTKARLAINFSRHLPRITRPQPQVPSDIMKKYRLLNYVVEYWIEHTKELELGRKFRDLVMYKSLSCEFRPWGLNRHFGLYGCTSCPDPSKAEELPFTSLFHYAAEVGHWGLMEPLVAEYCQHEVPVHETLLIACNRGQNGIVRKLIDTIDFDLSDGHVVNAAVAAGHAKVLQSLLELTHCPKHSPRKSSFYHFPEHAVSLLNLAATNGHEEVMDCILAFHEINFARSQNFHLLDLEDVHTGRTALFSAVMNGHERIARNLLAKGAKIEAHGTTAAHFAAEYGQQNMLRMLMIITFETKNYGTIEIDNEDGTNPWLYMIQLGYFDRQVEMPLHKAAKNGHTAVVEMIHGFWIHYSSKDARRHINLKNGDGYTPLNLAARGGHLDVLTFLLDHGASLTETTHHEGWTALHSAAAMGHEAVVQSLLRYGAIPELRAKDGSSAFELAVCRDHDGVVRAFLDAYNIDKLTPHLDEYRGMVATIEMAVENKSWAVLRVLLEDGVAIYGKFYVEKILLQAKHEGRHGAATELSTLLKERSWE